MKNEEMQELADKLDQLLAREEVAEIHILTAEEVTELRRVLVFARRVYALGWWGKWLFYAVVTAGAILANWERIADFLGGGQ